MNGADVKPERKSRGAFHHGNLREAALELAEAEVFAHGHDKLSVNQVAQRLGVTGPALYRHFHDRRALLDEVAQRGYERFEARLTRAYESKADPWQALAATGLAYLDFAHENPRWFRLAFFSEPADRPRIDLERAPARYQQLATADLAKAFGNDAARASSAFLGLWALVHGLAALLLHGNLPFPDERAERAALTQSLERHVEALHALAKSQEGRAR